MEGGQSSLSQFLTALGGEQQQQQQQQHLDKGTGSGPVEEGGKKRGREGGMEGGREG